MASAGKPNFPEVMRSRILTASRALMPICDASFFNRWRRSRAGSISIEKEAWGCCRTVEGYHKRDQPTRDPALELPDVCDQSGVVDDTLDGFAPR